MSTRLVLPGIVVLALIATMVAVIYACLRLFAGFANDDHRNYEDYVARFDKTAFDVTLVMRREDYGRDPDAPGPAETELHWLKSGPNHRLSYETDRATTGTYFIDQQAPTTISCTGQPPSNCRPNTELGEPEIWHALLAGVMVGVFGSSSPSLIAEGPRQTRARDDLIGGRPARCFSLSFDDRDVEVCYAADTAIPLRATAGPLIVEATRISAVAPDSDLLRPPAHAIPRPANP